MCIYQLDAPIVTAGHLAVTTGTTASLSSAFTAVDPVAAKAITGWQLYNAATTDSIAIGGVLQAAAHAAVTACTTVSLANVCLVVGGATPSDTLVRPRHQRELLG